MRVKIMLAGLLVAVLALAGALTWRALQTPRGPRGPAAAAAREACDDAARFIALVDRNAAADDVRRELATATRAAQRAVTLDGRWVQLLSGLETFDVALTHDDAGSANVAVRVVRAACSPFGTSP